MGATICPICSDSLQARCQESSRASQGRDRSKVCSQQALMIWAMPAVLPFRLSAANLFSRKHYFCALADRTIRFCHPPKNKHIPRYGVQSTYVQHLRRGWAFPGGRIRCGQLEVVSRVARLCMLHDIVPELYIVAVEAN